MGHCLRRWPGIETLDKCIFIIRSRDSWSRSGHRDTLLTLLALNGGSPDIEPTMDPIKDYCRASQKAVSSHFTSKQILPFAF